MVKNTRDNRESRQGKKQKLRWTHAPSDMWYNRDNGDGKTGWKKRQRRRSGTTRTATKDMRYSGDGGFWRRAIACNSVLYWRNKTCKIVGDMAG